MSYTPKDNSGNLFKIDDPKSERHPGYEGEFSSNCPHCGAAGKGWVKGWIREDKTGRKYFSLAFKFRDRQ